MERRKTDLPDWDGMLVSWGHGEGLGCGGVRRRLGVRLLDRQKGEWERHGSCRAGARRWILG